MRDEPDGDFLDAVLFIQAGAVVTDAGGVLAHTAVIAREYGVPRCSPPVSPRNDFTTAIS